MQKTILELDLIGYSDNGGIGGIPPKECTVVILGEIRWIVHSPHVADFDTFVCLADRRVKAQLFPLS